MSICIRIVLALLAALGPVREAQAVSRNSLWLVVRTCIEAERLAGLSFPCLRVKAGDAANPGYALVRPPGAQSHLLLVPTTPVSGIEAPALQRDPGAAYWRDALEARQSVVDALKGRVSLNDVALAVNSKGGRSQDQLHIHLDCVAPRVRTALNAQAGTIDRRWTRLPFMLEKDYYYVMRVSAVEARSFNPFATLINPPFAASRLSSASLAAVATSPNDPNAGFYILAFQAPFAHAERLLDHQCEIAAKVVAQ
ncbi:CDP-diacylglycerol diphosphatase [Methylobacterium sp. ID0610]|uniref:CDP-diacylglycerol diphosphatase n=1 Tax=Methylobacterium carpenticola TaxID=3344827 RepID=UPI0036C9D286